VTARLDLHETLERHAYEHAVICTYTFEPTFFEGYCLDRFRSLSGSNNITVLIDRGTYDELSHTSPSSWPRLANIRYLLHPIRVPGTFHPKVFLFASRDRGLLVIGSANFTKPGLTANAELVGVFRYERETREEHLGLFQDAVGFIKGLAQRWPGRDLDSNLTALVTGAPWLHSTEQVPAPALRFVHNLDERLWPQIVRGLSPGIDELHVLSRYFDSAPGMLDRVGSSVGARNTSLWTENRITTMTTAWFDHPSALAGATRVIDCAVADDGHHQPLHAKALAFVNGATTRLAYGSANFTTAALFTTAAQGNVEVMLVADELPSAACRPAELFDPCGTARPLTANDLVTAPHEATLPPGPAHVIVLHEASLAKRTLTCRCDGASGVATSTALAAILVFGDGGEVRVPLVNVGPHWGGTLDELAEVHCRKATTMVHVERVGGGGGEVERSNRLLLVNLLAADTGHSQRRERRIREAQRSAVQFAAMLAEMLHRGEEDALKTFLTHCDIPLIEGGRPFQVRQARPPWDGRETFGAAPERNLRDYASLHDAAMGFCERHLRRMDRHTAKASVAGIPNFMHMALAVGGVLRAQVERALSGLESTRAAMSADEWSEHRLRLGLYVSTMRDVVKALHDRYLPALAKRFKREPIREALLADLSPMATLYAAFVDVRARVEACRRGAFMVVIPGGRMVVPPIFPSDVLAERGWNRVETELRVARTNLVELIGAAA